MLLMPQSPPLPIHDPMATMSLAILPPTRLAYTQPSTSRSLPSTPSPSKKPRLSLNTANVEPSVFGKRGATSLRLETLSATSPTARNTFRNAHDEPLRRRANSPPRKPTLAPLATDITEAEDDTDTTDDSASSSTTNTSYSTALSTTEPPYKLSYNVTSILSNSPLPKPLKRRTSFTQIRPMFPAAKKVAFRNPLTEDVKNTKFTLRHSDIDSSTSTISTLELSPPEHKSESDKEGTALRKDAQLKRPASPKTGDKRDSSSDEDESDACPATPVAGRRKRHRQWVWTLGPVAQSDSKSEDLEQASDEHKA